MCGALAWPAARCRPRANSPPRSPLPLHPRKEHKEQRRQRKAQKNPNVPLIETATALWEELRRHDVQPARRGELVAAILAKLEGKLAEVSRSPKASRIVQTCVKFGSQEQRAQVLAELRPILHELIKSPHGHFIVLKLIATASEAQLKGADESGSWLFLLSWGEEEEEGGGVVVRACAGWMSPHPDARAQTCDPTEGARRPCPAVADDAFYCVILLNSLACAHVRSQSLRKVNTLKPW